MMFMEVEMTSHAGFETATEALEFIFGGNARFTLTSTASGKHFTFKASKGKTDGTPFFIKLLNGPNNAWDGDWLYIGFVPEGERDKLIAGRRGHPNAPSFTALAWMLRRLAADKFLEALVVQHDGSCGVCGRELTDPISVATGIGPVCRDK